MSYNMFLQGFDPNFRMFLENIPRVGFQRLPQVLHLQILEWFTVLDYAVISEDHNFLDIGYDLQVMVMSFPDVLVCEIGSIVVLDLGR